VLPTQNVINKVNVALNYSLPYMRRKKLTVSWNVTGLWGTIFEIRILQQKKTTLSHWLC